LEAHVWFRKATRKSALSDDPEERVLREQSFRDALHLIDSTYEGGHTAFERDLKGLDGVSTLLSTLDRILQKQGLVGVDDVIEYALPQMTPKEQARVVKILCKGCHLLAQRLEAHGISGLDD
jgi:hypothetical protein